MRNLLLMTIVTALYVSAASLSMASDELHSDYRATKKLQLDLGYQLPQGKLKSSSSIQTSIEAFLEENKSSYGISKISDLELVSVKQSLLGSHYYFKQVLHGYDVDHGGISVSTNKSGSEIYQVYNNYYPVPKNLQNVKSKRSVSEKVISKDEAFEVSWKDLSVHGKLLEAPTSRTVFIANKKGEFTLAVKTLLHVEAPFGAWEHILDAKTGDVLSRRDTRIERIKSNPSKIDQLPPEKIWDRNEEFTAFAKRSRKGTDTKGIRKNNVKTDATRVSPSVGNSSSNVNELDPPDVVNEDTVVNGTGLVFDPDPRTTLGDSSLQDGSSSNAFETAYFERMLQDITKTGDTYKLRGPWVQLIDFESPSIEPSESLTGDWTAKRGNVAFNDVMTYFHLDQSQRYMQSLGFEGETGIQNLSIEVDANGVNGGDNSHFIPSSNRLAFGHGCVDDNEDADVILHEYGHAINKSINRDWSGGDTGAMGEGFGDYWAGSYSISMNPLGFEKNRVFNWDGSPCWSGRSLNASNARYDHSRVYRAHSFQGGFVSDELWSTPLYQTLLALMAQGVERREVDQIILEAQFGLGSGLKMRDLARSVVSAAMRLYPDGPHASEFVAKFSQHKIMEVPAAVVSLGAIVIDGVGEDGALDPGDTALVSVSIKNTGTSAAEQIIGLLSTEQSGVTIVENSSSFPELDIGATIQNLVPFQVKLASDFQCGDVVDLNLGLGFAGGASVQAQLPLSLQTGRPIGAIANISPDLSIPDVRQPGITSELVVSEAGLVSENFTVNLNIKHTYQGDLQIFLISPAGTRVKLHDRSGGGTDNINGIYPTTLEPASSLLSLVGEDFKGTWTLEVSDRAAGDIGKLIDWGISDVLGYDCN